MIASRFLPRISPSLSGATRASGASGRRDLLVYAALVVLPGAAAAVLLWRLSSAGGDGARGSAPTAATLALLLLTMAMVIGACRLAGSLARRLGQPVVLGEIVGGILLGPSLLGALWPASMEWVAAADFGALAQLGVVIFVFLAGVEIDTQPLGRLGRATFVVSHVGIAVPLLLGVVLALFAYPSFAPARVAPAHFALFLGVAMSMTALPVMARILDEIGHTGTRLGTVAMTAAMIADVTAWCLLALTMVLMGGGSAFSLVITLASVALLVAFLMFGVRPLLRVLAARGRTSEPVLAMVLMGALLSSAAAEWAGVHAIFGAFLYGLAIPRDSAIGQKVRARLEGLTGALLLPLFFASTGLHTDLGLLGMRADHWIWYLAVLVVACVGKLAATTVSARLVGFGPDEAFRLGALMNCRGVTELILLTIGLSIGVIGPEIFTMFVVMALVSTAMTKPLLRLPRTHQPSTERDRNHDTA